MKFFLNRKFKNKILLQVSIVLVLLALEFTIMKTIMNDELSEIKDIYKVRVESLENLTDEQSISEVSYLNLSVDDVIDVFEDLNSKKYESIFDNSLFSYLYDIHNLYGVKVVLYCFYENSDTNFNLAKMTDRYKEEFQENSSWLKIGFHSLNGQTDYAETTTDELIDDYSKVIEEIVRFAGEDSLSQVVRLQGFYGTNEGLSALNSIDNGVKCFLTADDNRISYELTTEEISMLNLNRLINVNGIYYLRTDLRIENIENLDDVLKKIESREDPNYIIFTHERKLNKKVYREYLDKILYKALESNYYFDFVRMNK